MRTKPALAALAAAALTVLLAGPAAAHVTVNPREAPKGGRAELTFRVPNERDDASTTKLEVTFPADHPIASASVKPVPGWTIDVERGAPARPVESHGAEVTEVVTKITWSGGKIAPGQYENFSISAGPFPEDADQLVFKAVQTYDNGEVVSWIQEPAPGAEEPENPAPVLKLVAAEAEQGGAGNAGSAGSAEAGDGSGAPTVDAASQSEVDSAKRLGLLGVASGVIGLLAGVAALVAAGRRRGADSEGGA